MVRCGRMAFVVVLMLAGSAEAALRLGGLFSDHMVVQRGIAVPVWGWAEPGAKVIVEFAGRAADGQAGSDGRWRVTLAAMAAGGPFELVVRCGEEEVRVGDVLVGEVWIGSGQSNMAWPVWASANASEEAAAADWPRIRLYTVPQVPSAEPADDVKGAWALCTPETVPHFSAVLYYFGRELHRELDVPVGLINSSWGGTNAETWTPKEGFASDPALRPTYEQLRLDPKDAAAGRKVYMKALADWEEATDRSDTGNVGFEQGWAKPNLETGDWVAVTAPGQWQYYGDEWNFNGVVWFRREVTIPESWAGRELTLSLGAVDDFDTTYFNGERVGATGSETTSYWVAPREYRVPGRLVRPGRAVVAVRAFDHYGGGGFSGGEMKLVPVEGEAAAIDLTGTWLCKVERKLEPKRFDLGKPMDAGVPGAVNSPVSLYNGMIHPLAPYAIRGAIWYQGESNAGQGRYYTALMSGLIGGWRKVWGQGDFAFGVVQLANFQSRAAEPGESGWARLREAQLKILDDVANAGLAVAIDIGDAEDIHPKNKQEVGRRLGLWARAKVYGEEVAYSGPIYRSMEVRDGKVYLRFDHVDGGLAVRGEKLAGFAIAGPDQRFVWAEAAIEGDRVAVWSDQVSKPAAVRYGWADNPECNLYNEAGLPASPFRTDAW